MQPTKPMSRHEIWIVRLWGWNHNTKFFFKSLSNLVLLSNDFFLTEKGESVTQENQPWCPFKTAIPPYSSHDWVDLSWTWARNHVDHISLCSLCHVVTSHCHPLFWSSSIKLTHPHQFLLLQVPSLAAPHKQTCPHFFGVHFCSDPDDQTNQYLFRWLLWWPQWASLVRGV